MHLIDTHTHLDFPDFDADRAAVLARSRALGVREMVVLGVYQGNWQRLWALVESDPHLYAAFGLHPVYLAEHSADDLIALGTWLQRLRGHRGTNAFAYALRWFRRIERAHQRNEFASLYTKINAALL